MISKTEKKTSWMLLCNTQLLLWMVSVAGANLVDYSSIREAAAGLLGPRTFVVDGESKIEEILNSLEKPVVITEFIRMGLGEGIEKKSEDFANEVDSLIS